MLRATLDCLEGAKPPTAANRARVLGRSRQAVWEFDKRHPDFWEWQDAVVRRVSSNKWGLVKNRAADLAIQGSSTHAEIFCRMESGHYGRGVPNDGLLAPSVPTFHMNFLIPRPEPVALLSTSVAPAPTPTATAGPPAAGSSLIPRPPASPGIPTVAVRR
jgi:hypothetical protein